MRVRVKNTQSHLRAVFHLKPSFFIFFAPHAFFALFLRIHSFCHELSLRFIDQGNPSAIRQQSGSGQPGDSTAVRDGGG